MHPKKYRLNGFKLKKTLKIYDLQCYTFCLSGTVFRLALINGDKSSLSRFSLCLFQASGFSFLLMDPLDIW
jgi:hypothetical protein